MVSQQQAFRIAEKVLGDVQFWDNDLIHPDAKLIQGENLSGNEDPYLLVSWNYSTEDFDNHLSPCVFVKIDVNSGKVYQRIIHRSGGIVVCYDEQNDNYFKGK